MSDIFARLMAELDFNFGTKAPVCETCEGCGFIQAIRAVPESCGAVLFTAPCPDCNSDPCPQCHQAGEHKVGCERGTEP